MNWGNTHASQWIRKLNSLHAYRERVCLLQFSTPERDYLVDVLALDDISPLSSIFSAPHIEKIFHAAEYDILCRRICRDFGFVFVDIFDTMSGHFWSQDGRLGSLVGGKVCRQGEQAATKADWGARPLSPELLRYAAQDTHYLIPLREMLVLELQEKGLLNFSGDSAWRVQITSLRRGIAPSRLPGSASDSGVTLASISPSSRSCRNGVRIWLPFLIVLHSTSSVMRFSSPITQYASGRHG